MSPADAPDRLRPPLPLAPGAAPLDTVLWLKAADGTGLRAGIWRPKGAERGLALLLPGRAEYLEKLAIPAAALCKRGYAVAAVDFRGQGLSQRPLPDPLRGHVKDFAEYGADLAALLAAPEVARLGPPRLVLAHSMAGPVALGALAAGGLPPVPLLLSAPMFGVAMGPLMRAFAHVAVAAARGLGRLERWPPFGPVARPYSLAVPFEGNLLTGDRAVWNWMATVMRAEPRLQLGMPTLGWFAAAERAMAGLPHLTPPPVPALCLLGGEERVVEPVAIRRVCAAMSIPLTIIEGARHEPLVEADAVRSRAWSAIDAWLARL